MHFLWYSEKKKHWFAAHAQQDLLNDWTVVTEWFSDEKKGGQKHVALESYDDMLNYIKSLNKRLTGKKRYSLV